MHITYFFVITPLFSFFYIFLIIMGEENCHLNTLSVKMLPQLCALIATIEHCGTWHHYFYKMHSFSVYPYVHGSGVTVLIACETTHWNTHCHIQMRFLVLICGSEMKLLIECIPQKNLLKH